MHVLRVLLENIQMLLVLIVFYAQETRLTATVPMMLRSTLQLALVQPVLRESQLQWTIPFAASVGLELEDQPISELTEVAQFARRASLVTLLIPQNVNHAIPGNIFLKMVLMLLFM